jgi:hypothetical protein
VTVIAVVMVVIVIMILIMIMTIIFAGIFRGAAVVSVLMSGGFFVEFHNAIIQIQTPALCAANAPQDHYKGKLQTRATGLQELKIR